MKRSKKISVLRECVKSTIYAGAFTNMIKAISITISMISTTNLYSDRKKTTLSLTGIQSVKLTNCKKQRSRMIYAKR